MSTYDDILEEYKRRKNGEASGTPDASSPTEQTTGGSSYDDIAAEYQRIRGGGQTAPAAPEEQPVQPARQRPVASPLRPGRAALIQDDTTQQQAQTPQKSFASDPFGFLFAQPKQAQQQEEQAKQPSDPTAEAGRGKTLPGGQRMETIDPGRLTQESGAEDYSKQTLGKIAGHGAYAAQALEPKMPEATGPARGAGLRQLEEYNQQWDRREEARRAAAEPKDLTAIYNQANADYEALSRDIEALEAEIPRLEEELRVNGQYYGPEWAQDLERKRQQLEAERAQLEEARNAREAAFLALPEEQREQMNRNFIQRAWAAVQSGTERAVATFGRVGWQAIDGLFGRGGVVDTVLGGIPWGVVDGAVEILRDITGSDDTSMVDPLGDLAARASNTAGQYEARAAARLQYESDPVKAASDILYNAEIMLPYLLLVKASGGTSIIGGAEYAGAGTTAGLEYLSAAESAGSSWAAARMAFGETVRLMAHDAGAQWTWLTQFAESAATAREEGADGLEILTYALTNASMNTLVEMGGGLQRNLGEGLRALRPDRLARTMLEESGEEELQHFFETGLKQVYKNVELYSEENPEALINPDVMTQIFIDTALTTPFIVLEGAAVDRFDYRRRARVAARNQATANEIEANLENATKQDGDEALIAELEKIESNRRLSRVFKEMYKTTPQEAIESIRQTQAAAEAPAGTPSVSPVADSSLREGATGEEEGSSGTPTPTNPVRPQEAAGAPVAQGGTDTAVQAAETPTAQAPVLNSNEGATAETQEAAEKQTAEQPPELNQGESAEQNHKKAQFQLIQQNHPNTSSTEYTWIDSVDDIKTSDEAFAGQQGKVTPDFTAEMIDEARRTGKITVYSSHRFLTRPGTFVTPSKMLAQDYAGGGKVYAKTVDVNDIAWIDEEQGQYAKVAPVQQQPGQDSAQERAGQAAAPTAQAAAETETPSVSPAADSSLGEGATGETGLVPRDPSAALRSAQDDGNGGNGTGENGPKEGQKRSKTESHTEQNIAGKLGGEQDAVYYTPKSERESLTNAINRVNSDYNGEVQRLSDKPMWTGEDIDTALTIYGFLQMDGVRTGDFSAAQAWGRLVSARGTESGRALQAFSKWTRTGAAAATQSMNALLEAKNLTEEDRTRITNDVYKFAQDYDSIEDGDLGSVRDLIRRQAKYRNTWTFAKKNFDRMLNEVEDFDWLKEFALRQMMNICADFTEEADLGQKVKTWQVNAQLSRLGTFFRNIGGNGVFGVQDTLSQDFFGVALDALVGKMTGKRTVAMDRGWLSSDARRGARQGLIRSILEVAGDVDMGEGGSKYGQGSNRTFKMTGGAFSRMMSRWEQALGYSLTSSDRFFRGGIEAEQLRGLSQFENLTDEERQALAQNMADYRLFQNHGLAYRLAKGIHDVGNVIGFGGQLGMTGRQGGFGAADLVMPYPGVPANLWAKALEYNPANIVKGGVELFNLWRSLKKGTFDVTKQQNAVMDVARGLHGTALLALLAAAFSKGIFRNADDEDDPNAQALARAEGRQGVQINLSAAWRWLNGKGYEWKDGDELMKIDWLEPMNAFMAIASLMANEDDFPGYAAATLEGSLQAALDMPVMENISSLVDSYNYSKADSTAGKVGDAAVSFGVDALTGLLPAPISQTARAMDPYQRDTAGEDALDTARRRLFNAIPGLRQTLPEKLDNFGNPVEQAESAYDRWMNSFVRPGAISDYKAPELYEALDKFAQRTGDKDVYPERKAPTSFGKGEDKVDMTPEERQLYQETYGKTCEDYYSSVLLGDAYKDLSDGEKQWLLGEIQDYAKHRAQQAVLGSRGESREDKTWDRVDRVAAAGVDPADYLLGRKQADTDGSGGTPSNQEVYNWLLGSDYSDRQQEAIWDATKGSSTKSWDEYRDTNPVTYLMNAGMTQKGAQRMYAQINTDGRADLTQRELYQYYLAHPEAEELIREYWDNQRGFADSWAKAKSKPKKDWTD